MLEQGSPDRYEQVRKALDMRSQAFQRLLYWMRRYGIVRARAERPGVTYRTGVPVHLELSPKGKAMIGLLRHVEKGMRARREALGLRHANLLTLA